MLTFILGPSGSGKSRRMLAELRARAENGQRSLLIVPEQFTSSTEGTLYHILGDSLSAYVESFSFTSLAEALLRRYGGAVPLPSEMLREPSLGSTANSSATAAGATSCTRCARGTSSVNGRASDSCSRTSTSSRT